MAALRRLAAPQPPELLRVEVLARQSQVVEQPGLSRVRALQQVELRAVEAAAAGRLGGTASTLPGAAGAAPAACVMHSSATAARPANSLDMPNPPTRLRLSPAPTSSVAPAQ